jgi:hypothetical protein
MIVATSSVDGENNVAVLIVWAACALSPIVLPS